jgi:hypothetical protein
MHGEKNIMLLYVHWFDICFVITLFSKTDPYLLVVQIITAQWFYVPAEGSGRVKILNWRIDGISTFQYVFYLLMNIIPSLEEVLLHSKRLLILRRYEIFSCYSGLSTLQKNESETKWTASDKW